VKTKPDESSTGISFPIWISIAVALVSALTFLPALDGQFVSWDDNVMLTGNMAFRGVGMENIRWMFTSTLMGHYMPLTWLSFAASYTLGGMDARGFHLASLLLNAFNAALVSLLAWRLIDAARARRTRFTLPLSRRARVWPSASIHSTRNPSRGRRTVAMFSAARSFCSRSSAIAAAWMKTVGSIGGHGARSRLGRWRLPSFRRRLGSRCRQLSSSSTPIRCGGQTPGRDESARNCPSSRCRFAGPWSP